MVCIAPRTGSKRGGDAELQSCPLDADKARLYGSKQVDVRAERRFRLLRIHPGV